MVEKISTRGESGGSESLKQYDGTHNASATEDERVLGRTLLRDKDKSPNNAVQRAYRTGLPGGTLEGKKAQVFSLTRFSPRRRVGNHSWRGGGGEGKEKNKMFQHASQETKKDVKSFEISIERVKQPHWANVKSSRPGELDGKAKATPRRS